jgi:putative oxidoreductase
MEKSALPCALVKWRFRRCAGDLGPALLKIDDCRFWPTGQVGKHRTGHYDQARFHFRSTHRRVSMQVLFDKANPYLNVLARAMMSLAFLVAGWQKIAAYAGVQGFIRSLGVPGALLPLVITVEFGGAIALLLGYRTRLASCLLAGFTVTAAILVHFHPGDEQNMIVFMDNLAMAGGLLLFVQYGGGALSLDAARKQ